MQLYSVIAYSLKVILCKGCVLSVWIHNNLINLNSNLSIDHKCATYRWILSDPFCV